jgi:hypothetical protein
MPQHSYVTIAVKSYKNVKYKASFICCRLWASVMHAPISYKKNSWLHDDSSLRIARLRWWQFKTQELDNFKRACGSSCTCCILVRANETTETERNGIDACGKKRHWRLQLHVIRDYFTQKATVVSTSFPGSFLLLRKAPGWGWSRGTQILRAKIKLSLG